MGRGKKFFGVMEYWSNGVLSVFFAFIGFFHYNITPTLQYSITPAKK
jgi:hypothetical protein